MLLVLVLNDQTGGAQNKTPAGLGADGG